MQKPLIYADTSVYGGAFDPQFDEYSLAFFEEVRRGRFALATSDFVRQEIDLAPLAVRRLYGEMRRLSKRISVLSKTVELSEAYVLAGVVGSKSLVDAQHVATATTGQCDFLVSWNFSHIVHEDKMLRYNAVNVLHGHAEIKLRSPAEVI